MITHNEVIAGWWLLVAASSGTAGALLTWMKVRRQLDECCDCCTCQDCYEEVMPLDTAEQRSSDAADHLRRDASHGSRALVGVPRPEPVQELRQPVSAGPGYYGRRAVVLEPGPTIYPELAALAQAPVLVAESRSKAGDSTFIRTVLMDWELRYPIPQDSPNGNM